MMRGVIVAAAVLALPGCGKRAPDIEVRRLSDRVWLHDSSAVVPEYGRVHANGLIVVGRDGAVIVDSSWTGAQTAWLLDYVESATGRPARALVATHFHDDRAGGAEVARAAGVPVHASTRTVELLGAGGGAITHPFEASARIELGDVHVELWYPGAGHSPDNIVVYVEEERLLFGGCLVRAGASSWIGNLSDADLAAWPATMDRVIERYADAAVVVPGHGAVGDASLLPHTRALAIAALRDAPN